MTEAEKRRAEKKAWTAFMQRDPIRKHLAVAIKAMQAARQSLPAPDNSDKIIQDMGEGMLRDLQQESERLMRALLTLDEVIGVELHNHRCGTATRLMKTFAKD